MRILAIERSVESDGDEPVPEITLDDARAEARAVWELNQAGIVREVYFHADMPSAILVLECENAAQASEILASLPLVEMGAIEFEILPLRAYPGFERLFAETE